MNKYQRAELRVNKIFIWLYLKMILLKPFSICNYHLLRRKNILLVREIKGFLLEWVKRILKVHEIWWGIKLAARVLRASGPPSQPSSCTWVAAVLMMPVGQPIPTWPPFYSPVAKRVSFSVSDESLFWDVHYERSRAWHRWMCWRRTSISSGSLESIF